MSAAIEDLSSFFFSTGIVAPEGAVAPSDLFFIPTQLQSGSHFLPQHLFPCFLTYIFHTGTEFNTQLWSISNNELPATEPQAESSLGQDALAGDDDDFVSYFANLFGNENDADSAGQMDTQQGDWQPSVNNHHIHTEEPHELFGQKRIDEFIGWDFSKSLDLSWCTALTLLLRYLCAGRQHPPHRACPGPRYPSNSGLLDHSLQTIHLRDSQGPQQTQEDVEQPQGP